MPDETIDREFYKSGLLRQEVPTREGVPHGLWRTFHNNGQLESEKPFVEGKLHGICRQWAWNGKLLGSYEMIHGTGIQRHWYENGQLCSELSTVDGKFTGRVRHWLADGTLDTDKYLVEGQSVTRQAYYAAAVSDSGFPNYDDEDFQPVDLQNSEIERKRTELLVEILMSRPNHQEVLAWLEKDLPERPKTLGRFTDAAIARATMTRFYDAGAARIEALDIYASESGQEFSDRVAVFLSTEETIRRRIRDLCDQMKQQFDMSISPANECAELVLILALD